MMKTIMRNLFVAAGFMFAVSVSAQETAPKASVSDFHVGDTIVIKKDHERYLTGEKMSKWVYDVEHTIQQVRGKRFPEGILIRGIYSWVGPDDILNKSTHPQEAVANQEAKNRLKNKLSKKLNRLLQKKKHVVLLRVKHIRIPFSLLKKKLLVRIPFRPLKKKLLVRIR